MIEDTSKRDPFIHFVGSMSSRGLTGYLAETQSAGQTQLVASEEVPRDANWEAFEALGIHRGEDVGGPNDLFCKATLPKGWTKVRGPDPRQSFLVDERGVNRVEIFYKADFHDRRANMYIMRVGFRLATHAIYGDEAPALPDKWDVLADAEKDDFHADLQEYVKKAQDPIVASIYEDRLPRVQTLINLAQGQAGTGPEFEVGDLVYIPRSTKVFHVWKIHRPHSERDYWLYAIAPAGRRHPNGAKNMPHRYTLCRAGQLRRVKGIIMPLGSAEQS